MEDKRLRKEFRSAGEFVDYVTGLKWEDLYIIKNGRASFRDLSSEHEDDPGWSGAKSFTEAIDRFWRPSKYIGKPNIGDINAIFEDFGVNVDYTPAEVGLFFDVAKVITGEPEAWIDMNTEAEDLGMNLVVGHKGLAWFENEQTVKNVAIGLSLIVEALVLSGVKINLLYLDVDECYELYFPIMSMGEIMSFPNLFAIFSTSFMRRLSFRMKENSPTWRLGYGHANYEYRPSEFLPKNVVNNGYPAFHVPLGDFMDTFQDKTAKEVDWRKWLRDIFKKYKINGKEMTKLKSVLKPI